MTYAFPPAAKPVYAPNSFGGPHADPARAAEAGGWQSDGELVRSAVTLHAGGRRLRQANALVNRGRWTRSSATDWCGTSPGTSPR